MKQTWRKLITKNFGRAALHYNKLAQLQKYFAWELAKTCAKKEIAKGIWADLGSGTGLLGDALEHIRPNQPVIRVDGSSKMLAQNQTQSPKILWDLNLGLPKLPEKPTLLASSFALHWLEDPRKQLDHWLSALPPNGWLAIALPIDGSFKEWHKGASKANVSYTAITLPSESSILSVFEPNQVKHQKIYKYQQTANNVLSLLHPIRKIGAHTNPHNGLSVGELRRLTHAWPKEKTTNDVHLTWLVQLLLVQR